MDTAQNKESLEGLLQPGKDHPLLTGELHDNLKTFLPEGFKTQPVLEEEPLGASTVGDLVKAGEDIQDQGLKGRGEDFSEKVADFYSRHVGGEGGLMGTGSSGQQGRLVRARIAKMNPGRQIQEV